MKIGIIVHSFTGNTLSVAEKIKEKLKIAGHEAQIAQIKIAGGEQPNMLQFSIEDAPETSGYDALVIGAPVRAFQASPVIVAYLSGLPVLNGKKTAVFVTKQLPANWMGGNSAIKKMKALCSEKGANVVATGIVNWSNKNREQMIEEETEKICKAIG